MNKPWVYVAWIRNHGIPEEDQDYEIPCVIIINAESDLDAKKWGDELYKEALSNDNTNSFLWSEVSSKDDYRNKDGRIFFSNDHINWSDIPVCTIGQRISADLLY